MSGDFYEIDFIPVGDGEKSGDAIAIRYQINDEKFVHIVDGGTLDSGEELSNHVTKFYGTDYIDHVVCTHADGDHSSGLRKIIEAKGVGTLWMNRPWLYADDLLPMIDDGRITRDSLIRRLKESYAFVAQLEELAEEKGVVISEAFEGTKIGPFTICSPSREMYISLIAESDKTPATTAEETIFEAVAKAYEAAKNWLFETWGTETLRDDVGTSPENETSVVQYGLVAGEKIFLTGDAGPRALTAALDYAEVFLGHSAGEIGFVQVPHHGSRHNVTPTVLDRLLGKAPGHEVEATNSALASVAKGADGYPRQAVINAFCRRGYSVSSNKGKTVCFSKNATDRAGWSPVAPHVFSTNVEAWD